jgi:hypothetical protein
LDGACTCKGTTGGNVGGRVGAQEDALGTCTFFSPLLVDRGDDLGERICGAVVDLDERLPLAGWDDGRVV